MHSHTLQVLKITLCILSVPPRQRTRECAEAVRTCLLFLTESKRESLSSSTGRLFIKHGRRVEELRRRPLDAEQHPERLRSYLTYLGRVGLFMYTDSGGNHSELLGRFGVALFCFFPRELLKACEPFSPSTWLVFSSWYKSLYFWKVTLVHTNSPLLLSNVDKSVCLWQLPHCLTPLPAPFFTSLSCTDSFVHPLMHHAFMYSFSLSLSGVSRLRGLNPLTVIRGSSRISQRLQWLQFVLTLGSGALCHISPCQLAVWALICQL